MHIIGMDVAAHWSTGAYDQLVHAAGADTEFGLRSLTNQGNMQYMGELYIGAPYSQKITDIAFDTGSDLLAIRSARCHDCPKDHDRLRYYNNNTSKASVERILNVTEAYGSAELNGTIFNDTVCLAQIDLRDKLDQALLLVQSSENDEQMCHQTKQNDMFQTEQCEYKELVQLVESEDNCISDLPFLAVEQEYGLDGSNGIVGLGPNSTYRASLLSRLKQGKKIDKAIISFDLGDSVLNQDSYALIGGVDLSLVADRKLYSYDLANDAYWSLKTKQIKYGDTLLGMHHVTTNQLESVAIIDTGTSLLAFPPELYQTFLVSLDQQLTKENKSEVTLNCSDDSLCVSTMNCTDLAKHLQPLKFQIGQQIFELSPMAYLLDGSIYDEELTDMCILGVQELPEILQDEPMILLGDVFIRQFYSVFDIDDQTIKLGVKSNKNHLAKIIDLGTTGNQELVKSKNKYEQNDKSFDMSTKNGLKYDMGEYKIETSQEDKRIVSEIAHKLIKRIKKIFPQIQGVHHDIFKFIKFMK